MYQVSDKYTAAAAEIQRIARGRLLREGGDPITDDGQLVSVKIERGGQNTSLIGNATSQKMTAVILQRSTKMNLKEGQKLVPQLGIEASDGSTELVPFTSITIDTLESDDVADTIEISGYDAMQQLNTHTAEEITVNYPATLAEYAAAAAACAGLELASTDFYNSNLMLVGAPAFSRTETLRNIMGKIAEAALGNAYIDRSGKLRILSLFPVGIPVMSIRGNRYFDFICGQQYGPINAVNISTDDDDMQKEDAESIKQNGRCELLIADNPILSPYRANVLDGMFEAASGQIVHPYKIEWRGEPALDIGDIVHIQDKSGVYYATPWLNEELSFSGGLSSTASIEAPSETKTGTLMASSSVENQLKEIEAGIYAWENTTDLVLESTPKQVCYIEYASSRATNALLFATFVLTGNGTVEARILRDNQSVGFNPVDAVTGAGTLSLTYPILQIDAGAHTDIAIQLICSSGSLTCKKGQARVAVYGNKLIGGLSGGRPHAEVTDLITWSEHRPRKNVTDMTEVNLFTPIASNPSDLIPFASIPEGWEQAVTSTVIVDIKFVSWQLPMGPSAYEPAVNYEVASSGIRYLPETLETMGVLIESDETHTVTACALPDRSHYYSVGEGERLEWQNQ